MTINNGFKQRWMSAALTDPNNMLQVLVIKSDVKSDHCRVDRVNSIKMSAQTDTSRHCDRVGQGR